MATVEELLPGDLVSQPGMSAVFVQSCEHPFYPGLRMVIWRMPDGWESVPRNGTWSHDALLAHQEVGDVAPATAAERRERLKTALFAPGTLND